MKRGLMIATTLLFVLFLTACGETDVLTGKTYQLSQISGPDADPQNPDAFYPVVKLEFSDGNVVKNKLGYEEGSYELKEDKLLLLFENENEKLEIEFTLEESDKEFIDYSASISNSDFQMEDSDQVSKLKPLFFKLQNTIVHFIEE